MHFLDLVGACNRPITWCSLKSQPKYLQLQAGSGKSFHILNNDDQNFQRNLIMLIPALKEILNTSLGAVGYSTCSGD